MSSSPPEICYSFEIEKEDFTKAGQASSTIKKLLRQLGISSSIIRRIAIASYEAEMNIVIHSNGGVIVLCVYPDYVQITAEDKGPGIEDIDLAMQEGYSTAPQKIREMGFGAGMGLPNMKRCCDDFSIITKAGTYTKIILKFTL